MRPELPTVKDPSVSPVSPTPTDLRAARAAIARAARARNKEAERAARQEYAAAKLADEIQAVIAVAPPLSPGQLARLRALLS